MAATPSVNTFAQTLRFLTIALMASLLVILAAIAAILAQNGGEPTGSVRIWTLLVVLVAAVCLIAALQRFGFRYQPIAPGTPEADARLSSAVQLQVTTLLRFAIAEAIALVAIVVGFVVSSGGLYPVLLGVAISEVVMFSVMWPRESLISRVQTSLERDGGLSFLREALDSPPPTRRPGSA
ncbi:MAG TPA: hypothetical protein VFE15_17170 [Marmoricola sp.]|jgi:F0F1-type ATP synthase membrane subunit c/vacuolar-type H+-ATPase subunit K|nr:hypothetical protein [Marmoricola sp.]